MNPICIFDTETTSLDKPFCYNIGYIIVDIETGTTLLQRDYVVEQIWHNLPLFQSAYYANKRPLYVSRMRTRLASMSKFGYMKSKRLMLSIATSMKECSPLIVIGTNATTLSMILRYMIFVLLP